MNLFLSKWRFRWSGAFRLWFVFCQFSSFWAACDHFGFTPGGILFIPKMFYIKLVYMVYSFNISVHSKHGIHWEIFIGRLKWKNCCLQQWPMIRKDFMVSAFHVPAADADCVISIEYNSKIHIQVSKNGKSWQDR